MRADKLFIKDGGRVGWVDYICDGHSVTLTKTVGEAIEIEPNDIRRIAVRVKALNPEARVETQQEVVARLLKEVR